MLEVRPYNRLNVQEYALRWALERNPLFYDFEEIGGDCTNFASQCLYAGTGIMNFTPTYGWYYIDPDNRAPAWTGVEFFYDFITRKERTAGPVGVLANMSMLLPGDFVQLRLTKEIFSHTPIIVEIDGPPSLDNILIAAHSYDSDYRPLSTYDFQEIRFLHIIGAYMPDNRPNMQ